MRCEFEVEGKPVPQGSMTASYNRKLGVAHVHHVQGAALAVWRASIREAARATGESYLSPLPIAMHMTFGMPYPKSHVELRGGRYQVKLRYFDARPMVMPDLDKLVRAVLDALTGVCYRDDAQVVEITASKVYGYATQIIVTDEIEKAQQSLALGMGET